MATPRDISEWRAGIVVRRLGSSRFCGRTVFVEWQIGEFVKAGLCLNHLDIEAQQQGEGQCSEFGFIVGSTCVVGPGFGSAPSEKAVEKFQDLGGFRWGFRNENLLGVTLKRKDTFGLECTIESRELIA